MENINKKAISELAELLEKHQLKEIEYEMSDTRIRVVAKGPEVIPPGPAVLPPAPAPIPEPVSVVSTTPIVTKENQVKSPMVGVVYLSSDPNSPNFVNVGAMVGPGQTLCLIEAMKTFNPVKAEKAGKIKQILVESGTPVEFNEPLFILE